MMNTDEGSREREKQKKRTNERNAGMIYATKIQNRKNSTLINPSLRLDTRQFILL